MERLVETVETVCGIIFPGRELEANEGGQPSCLSESVPGVDRVPAQDGGIAKPRIPAPPSLSSFCAEPRLVKIGHNAEKRQISRDAIRQHRRHGQHPEIPVLGAGIVGGPEHDYLLTQDELTCSDRERRAESDGARFGSTATRS